MTFGDLLSDIELSQYKFLTHLDKISQLARGIDVFPVTVELDLVDYCNHNCGWCVDPLHMSNRLPLDFIEKVLSELELLGVEGVVFKGGGEPTLSEHFTSALSLAKSHGLEAGVVTNGSRLLGLYGPVVEMADYLRVSIDGPTPESHRLTHSIDDLEDIIEGTRKATIMRKMLGQRHPIIGLSFAMDYPMKKLIPQAVELGDGLGVDYILFRPPFFEEVGRENRMTAQEKTETLAAMELAARSYIGKMKVMVDYWISDSEAASLKSAGDSPRRGRFIGEGNGIEHVTKRCLASPLLAVITADRKVYPCCNLRSMPAWSIGTLDYEHGQTFSAVWKGQAREDITRKIECIECIQSCTHPLSRYNEIIEYLKSPRYHSGFV
jgi:MoaA/NifB/PqqE/SkfB family radical SAM enzyme